jgi:hypothetical protein
MGKELFQLYLNTKDPNAQNVSPPSFISGTCTIGAGSSTITINSINNNIPNSNGSYVLYVPLIYGLRILIPSASSNPIYILTQITGTTGSTGTYYMSYTPLASQFVVPFVGLPMKNSYNFLVNWDTLFAEAKLANPFGKRCKVGIDFLSRQTVLNGFMANNIGVTQYRNSYIVCNLASKNVDKTLPYTILGTPDILNAAIEDPAILAIAPSYKSAFQKLNTMQSSQMTEIILPVGCSFLNISLMSSLVWTNPLTPQMIDEDWSCILTFEIMD